MIQVNFITNWFLQVCDSILNIGPCGFTVMGEPAFLSEEFGNLVDPDIELVSTSGYSKNGALSVLQVSACSSFIISSDLKLEVKSWIKSFKICSVLFVS